jgi:hypothetical protein
MCHSIYGPFSHDRPRRLRGVPAESEAADSSRPGQSSLRRESATPISFHSSLFPLFSLASNSPINFSNSAFLSGSPVVRASTPRNAKMWAVSNAYLAGTCTSGFTPTPS